MKVYEWPSRMLEESTYGSIVVMAENIEEAREKARNHFRRYWWGKFDPKGRMNEHRGKYLAQFQEDLRAEPKILTDGVGFYNGDG